MCLATWPYTQTHVYRKKHENNFCSCVKECWYVIDFWWVINTKIISKLSLLILKKSGVLTWVAFLLNWVRAVMRSCYEAKWLTYASQHRRHFTQHQLLVFVFVQSNCFVLEFFKVCCYLLLCCVSWLEGSVVFMERCSVDTTHASNSYQLLQCVLLVSSAQYAYPKAIKGN
jgi:hypothetical protein